jgi:regulator of protease activity HflC (stomatin/prohibitin superfamily)
MKSPKLEPTVIIQAASVLLSLLTVFGFYVFDQDQTWAILNFITVGLTLINGLSVRPFKWVLVTAVVQALIILVMQFGLEITPEQQAAVLAAVTVIGAIFIRQSVTPEVKLEPVLPGADGGFDVTSLPPEL